MDLDLEQLARESLGASSAFPLGEPNTAFAQYFIGNSYLAPLAGGVANVTFEPGCRNNWHVHHGERQVLVCTGGRGWYQEWGQPAQELHAGDVVDIQPEVKHWHGAAKDSWFTHIAIAMPVKGCDEQSNEWLEPVDDEQYGKLA
ncbi:cupin domain-containing protein [Enorma massiliensis]|uniref:cupin domain-containing protein n=1 Tax=Enorma massiliensis TaxID=1472761 RepID=UPI0019588BFB|nr:cupin domain-containing protein [Enorma massiliensis]MBM6784133.1 cupin domain-containing protein [Enorma massiliensis]